MTRENYTDEKEDIIGNYIGDVMRWRISDDLDNSTIADTINYRERLDGENRISSSDIDTYIDDTRQMTKGMLLRTYEDGTSLLDWENDADKIADTINREVMVSDEDVRKYRDGSLKIDGGVKRNIFENYGPEMNALKARFEDKEIADKINQRIVISGDDVKRYMEGASRKDLSDVEEINSIVGSWNNDDLGDKVISSSDSPYTSGSVKFDHSPPIMISEDNVFYISKKKSVKVEPNRVPKSQLEDRVRQAEQRGILDKSAETIGKTRGEKAAPDAIPVEVDYARNNTDYGVGTRGSLDSDGDLATNREEVKKEVRGKLKDFLWKKRSRRAKNKIVGLPLLAGAIYGAVHFIGPCASTVWDYTGGAVASWFSDDEEVEKKDDKAVEEVIKDRLADTGTTSRPSDSYDDERVYKGSSIDFTKPRKDKKTNRVKLENPLDVIDFEGYEQFNGVIDGRKVSFSEYAQFIDVKDNGRLVNGDLMYSVNKGREFWAFDYGRDGSIDLLITRSPGSEFFVMDDPEKLYEISSGKFTNLERLSDDYVDRKQKIYDKLGWLKVDPEED